MSEGEISEEELEKHEEEEEDDDDEDDEELVRDLLMKKDERRETEEIGEHVKYIDIDWPQVDEDGNEILMRITVPVIRESRKREFKKVVRKRIIEASHDDILEEESHKGAGEEGEEEIMFKDDIIEFYDAMVVMETVTKTVLIKTKNEDGEYEEIEHDVIEEFLISDDPSKFKVVAVKKVLSDGEEVLEEHITPELSVEEPYECGEYEEFGEEEFEEEASILEESKGQEEEYKEEEEEEDVELSFDELEEEEESRSEIKEMSKQREVSEEEEGEEEEDFGEYIEEEFERSEEAVRVEKGKGVARGDETVARGGEEGSEGEEEESESSEEEGSGETRGEEEVLVARFEKEYDVKEEVEEEIDLDETEKVQWESSESEEQSGDEEIEDEDEEIQLQEQKEVESGKGEEGERKESFKEDEDEMEEEELVDEGIDEAVEEEEYVDEVESEIDESDRHWWRTSGYDIDDIELPDDPIKANKMLQAELWRQLKQQDKYTKKVERYFRKHKDEICYLPPYMEVGELQKYYENELRELKQILDTFSDSYDDFNYRLALTKKKSKENDNLLSFFLDVLKKTLLDISKRTDRKTLTKIAKGKTLDQMIGEIFRLEDKLSFAYTRKAIYTLEMEELKTLLTGGETDQSNVELENRAIDLLLLVDMQSKCHHSIDLRDLQEHKVNEIKRTLANALHDYTFKYHEVTYNKDLKELHLKGLENKLKQTYQKRGNDLQELQEKLRMARRSKQISQGRLRKIRSYVAKKHQQ